MKRLLILSLLMIQGLWGAEAAGADVPVQAAQPAQRPKSLLQFASMQIAQDFVVADDERRADIIQALLETGINQKVIFSAFYKDLYVAWLNANPTQPIIVRQTLAQACQQMGITNVPAKWAQLIVDVSSHLRHGITSLRTRPGTIAHLIATRKIPLAHNGILNLTRQNLTVCDVWNLPRLDIITHLWLNSNQITAIHAEAFNGLVNLTHLYLNINQITALEAGTFAKLNALTHLHLNDNQIAALDAGTFAGLGALTNLHLNDNQIAVLDAGTFTGLNALNYLHLGNNQITALPAGTFAELGALTILDLHHNQITALPAGTFAKLGALTQLDLYNNQIAALEAGAFAGLVNLIHLDLNLNQLKTIAAGAFTGLNTLTQLWLDHNPELHLNNPDHLQSIQTQHPEWFTDPAVAAADGQDDDDDGDMDEEDDE